MGKGAQGSDAAAAGGEVEENMAAWLVAKNTLKIMPFKLPPVGPYDVRVRMKAVGICGSDVHYLREMRIAHFVVKEPMVIGHECAGVVEEVGAGVMHLSVGDRVALEPGVSCWRCRHCKGGRYNLCEDMKFFATPPVHGSLANQVVHPADLCFKLPDGVSLEEGAMCEPLSVGVHACRRAGVGPETGVLVVGAGPIGLVSLLAARAFGAPPGRGQVAGRGRGGAGVAPRGGPGGRGGAHPRGHGLGHRRQPGLRRVQQDHVDGAGVDAARREGVPGRDGPQRDDAAPDGGGGAGGGRQAAHHPPLRLLAAGRGGGLRGQRPRPRCHQSHVQPLGGQAASLSVQPSRRRRRMPLPPPRPQLLE
uniref:Alcohol dehydrogenase-like N-terminal domain-containing protein n=1 Tax=Zea mays TaxID=4577 RepID=A0A804LUI7_MAIZE